MLLSQVPEDHPGSGHGLSQPWLLKPNWEMDCDTKIRDCGQMVEQQSEARVGPIVEFANTGEREQGSLLFALTLATISAGLCKGPHPVGNCSRDQFFFVLFVGFGLREPTYS
jgi:hypothetical protein